MGAFASSAIADLVQPDRVHRAVYVDPELFELEMERIFGRTWIYVGHESQVPKPGDYVTTLIGREVVALVRDDKGAVHVLFNRCPHKGARVLPEGCGNAGKFLRCPFHGWSFRCDGSLLAVPLRQGYEGTGFDMKDPRFSMRRVPRQQSYRGFVFASLSADGVPLEAFLGGVATSLDNFCDRAPSGEVEVAGGVMRVIQKSNWKIFFENLNDTMHPMVTHESAIEAAREQHETMPDGTPMPFELHIVAGNGESYEFWEKLDLRGFDFGHSYMGAIFNPPKDPVSQSYIATLEAAQGKEKALEILSVQRHNTIIYPSCSPHTSFQQLRVIRPISVDRTLVEIFTFRLKGAPDSLFQRSLVYTNVVNSPSSVVMPDDVEVYNRSHEGLESKGNDWVSLHRDAGRDRRVPGGWSANGTSEMPMRNQFDAWRRYMTAEG